MSTTSGCRLPSLDSARDGLSDSRRPAAGLLRVLCGVILNSLRWHAHGRKPGAGSRKPGQLLVVLALGALAACGKKGPPLPPLYIIPDAVSEVTLRRLGDDVQIRFVLPAKNANGPTPVNLDHIEIYATTVAAGAAAPPNREFLHAKYRIATIPVRPPVDPDAPAPPPDAPKDDRPGAGEPAGYVESLDAAKLRPVFTTIAAASAPSASVPAPSASAPAPSAPAPAPSASAPVPPATTAPPGTSPQIAVPAANPATASAGQAAASAPAPPVPVPTRIYAIRGIARNGRPGSPSARLTLPLIEAPPAPSNVQVNFTATEVAVTWLPPVAIDAAAKPPAFNVYAATGGSPLNPAPLESPAFQRSGVEFGKEECFVVRSVSRVANVTIESAATDAACVTPKDIFPPAPPATLQAVSSEGAVNLIWDAVNEADVAGYIVLRAEAPSDTLAPITKEPLTQPGYRDTAVTLGMRYIYAVVAVDKAGNTSPQSRRVEETVR